MITNKRYTQEELEYIKNNFKNMTCKEIGEALGRTEQSVRAKCFDLNLHKKEAPWTDDEIDFIKQNYMEMKTSDICRVLQRSKSAVELKASRLGLKKYPYTCDYNYFDNIDTEDKAYWLGFLSADGWTSKNEKSNAGATGIDLQYEDINHLKKFNKCIKGNYKITDKWKECNISTKDKIKKHHICSIRIFSLTMHESLVNKGFTKNKSYEFKIPDIDKSLIRHFIRGYFDGDGCFTFTNKTFHISFITASKFLSDDIVDILKSQGLNATVESYVNSCDTTMYRPTMYKNDDKIKFLDWIYEDCKTYLDRKYKKYLKVKKHYETTQSLAV